MTKLKVIVSDLHVGAGGDGNPLEDFTLDAPFSRFLSELVDESEATGSEVELILAGDVFEFLQVPVLPDPEAFDPLAAYATALYLPSNETSAVAKMRTMIAGHPRFFAALAAFLHASTPRRTITLLKGNHDVELHWQGVQQLLREALGAGEALRFEDRRISREGLYVEHGNQYAEAVSRLRDMTEPHDMTSGGSLLCPLGSRFVMRLLNPVERERFWIDGVKPITALIWYLLALDTRLGLRALALLLREVPEDVLSAQARMLAADASADLLDVPQTPEEVASLCERIAQAIAPWGQPEIDSEAILSARGALSWSESALQRGWVEEQAHRDALVVAAGKKAIQEHAQVVVFGHSHAACSERLPKGATYLNAGTWTWVRSFEGADESTWRELFAHPERFMSERHPTYVRVDYDEAGIPQATLRQLTVQMPRPSLLRRLRGWLRGNR